MEAEESRSIEEWFASAASAACAPSAGGGAAKGEGGSEPAAVAKAKSLLDSARTQKVLIMVGRLKLNTAAIVKIIVGLDPLELTQEMIEVLMKVVPTQEEIGLVSSVETSELDNVGQLFLALSHIPRLEHRLKCHDMCLRFRAEHERLSLNLSVLDQACEELHRSEPVLRRILQVILADGNYLNGGTPRGQAYGVKLDVLMKISAVKGTPPALVGAPPLPTGGMSLVNFVAMQAETKDKALLALAGKQAFF